MADLCSSPASRAPYGNDLNCTFGMRLKHSKLELIESPNSSINSSAEISNEINDADARPTPVHDFIDKQWKVAEEQCVDAIRDVHYCVRELGEVKLKSMRNEVLNCDPYRSGVIDTKTMQRIINRYLQQIQLPPKSWRTLTLMFARESDRPVEVLYEPLFHFMRRLFLTHNIQYYAAAEPEKEDGADNEDDELRNEIVQCLKNAGIGEVDTARLQSSFSICDRDGAGALSEEQLTAILIALQPQLSSAIQPVLQTVLTRCAVGNAKYDWKLFCDLINNTAKRDDKKPANENGMAKSNGATEAISMIDNGHNTSQTDNKVEQAHIAYQATPTRKSVGGRRDMQSSLNGLPGSLFASLPSVQPLPPIKQLPPPITVQKSELKPIRAPPKPLPNIPSNAPIVETNENDLDPGIRNLIGALNRLDPMKSGRVRVNRAKQIIQQYKDLHGLHISPKKLDQLLFTAQDSSEAYINLNIFNQGLKNI